MIVVLHDLERRVRLSAGQRSRMRLTFMQTLRTFQQSLATHRGLSLLWVLTVLMLLSLLSPTRAFAQAGATGAISGILTDSQGGVIPQAAVTATNVATGVTSRTTTNAE